MTDIQIFDTVNIDDLPQKLQTSVKNEFESNIIKLFKIANRPLHVNEVTVAYYRKYGVEKTKRQILVKLYNMSHIINPKIVKHRGKGYYKLAEKELNK